MLIVRIHEQQYYKSILLKISGEHYVKRKYSAPVSNRLILEASLEVSDFLRNVCLKLRIRFYPVRICRLFSPIHKQAFFFFPLTGVLKTPFLSTFFHSVDYGLFLQPISGRVFWTEFRGWENNQLCRLVKSLLYSFLVSSPY